MHESCEGDLGIASFNHHSSHEKHEFSSILSWLTPTISQDSMGPLKPMPMQVLFEIKQVETGSFDTKPNRPYAIPICCLSCGKSRKSCLGLDTCSQSITGDCYSQKHSKDMKSQSIQQQRNKSNNAVSLPSDQGHCDRSPRLFCEALGS